MVKRIHEGCGARSRGKHRSHESCWREDSGHLGFRNLRSAVEKERKYLCQKGNIDAQATVGLMVGEGRSGQSCIARKSDRTFVAPNPTR